MKVLQWIIIGILLACIGYLTYRTVSGNKQIKMLGTQLSAVQHAPVIVDTVHDTIRIPGMTLIKPVPVQTVVHDTIIREIRELWYDSIYRANGIRFRYQAHTWGDLDLTFSDFVIPKEIITIRKPFDTCYLKPPEYKAKKFHLGLYSEMVVKNFSSFPGIGIGGQLIYRDQITVGLGGVYCNGLYGNLRIGVLLK